MRPAVPGGAERGRFQAKSGTCCWPSGGTGAYNPAPIGRARPSRSRQFDQDNVLRPRGERCGELPEWPNGLVSKTRVSLRAPGVRIPRSPPLHRVAGCIRDRLRVERGSAGLGRCRRLRVQAAVGFAVDGNQGEVSEWFKEHAWKACVSVFPAPWVRIPPSPPSARSADGGIGRRRRGGWAGGRRGVAIFLGPAALGADGGEGGIRTHGVGSRCFWLNGWRR